MGGWYNGVCVLFLFIGLLLLFTWVLIPFLNKQLILFQRSNNFLAKCSSQLTKLPLFIKKFKVINIIMMNDTH